MRTGTDISIPECRASGYPVVEHHSSKMNPKKDYLLTISNPSSWADSGGGVKPGRGHTAYRVYTFVSYQEMWERFEKQGEGIKKFCDFENCPLPTPENTSSFHDFVNLASILDSYCGIE